MAERVSLFALLQRPEPQQSGHQRRRLHWVSVTFFEHWRHAQCFECEDRKMRIRVPSGCLDYGLVRRFFVQHGRDVLPTDDAVGLVEEQHRAIGVNEFR